MTDLFCWNALPSNTRKAVRRNAKRISRIELNRFPLRRAMDTAEGTWDFDSATGVLAGFDRTTTLFDPLWRCSQDLLLVCDRQGVIRAANPAWTRLLGWQPADLLGRNHLDFVDSGDYAASAAAFGATQAGAPSRCESRMRHRDGSARWVAWAASPEDGLVFASGRPVTAEKAAAEALAHAEDQLRQSRKMQAVGQLTGGIAHDFNNLLTGIIGNLDLLQRRIAAGRSEGLERCTAMALASAERAAALTQRLLTFARPQPPGPKRVEVNQLLAGMEDLLRRALEPVASLEMAPGGALWPALCDPNQLENAILNLAINARDAMPNGGQLRVETANAQFDAADAEAHGGVGAGQYVAIAVTDTGFGMGPDVVAKAFDPFFTTKPTGQGTGLGLSMLDDFIKQSNGHVLVESEPGSGTTFRIYLPRCRNGGECDASEPAKGPATAVLAGASGTATGRNEPATGTARGRRRRPGRAGTVGGRPSAERRFASQAFPSARSR